MNDLCSQCGTPLARTNRYCASCGAQRPPLRSGGAASRRNLAIAAGAVVLVMVATITVVVWRRGTPSTTVAATAADPRATAPIDPVAATALPATSASGTVPVTSAPSTTVTATTSTATLPVTTPTTTVPAGVTRAATTDDLRLRRTPSSSGEPAGTLKRGEQIRIVCQAAGTRVATESMDYWSVVWDKLVDGTWVTDLYINNEAADRPTGDGATERSFTASIPRCP